MANYVFRCDRCKEPDGQPLTFSVFLTTIPKKVVKERKCDECGEMAKRAFDIEIESQSVIGITPISKSTTTPGSLYHTVRKAFGDHDSNDPNQAPFRDSGELNAFMNGANEFGAPKIDQRTGKPLRRPDGSVVRNGAKLIKYDRNATPSRDDVRRRTASRSAKWRGGEGKFEFGSGADIRITS